ncbi:site-specific integrase [Yinghuangia aomiensis]
MVDPWGRDRDLAALVLPEVGRLVATGDVWEPYRLLDAAGAVVGPVAAYFAELQAANSSGKTVRSYGMDLLRWFRFLWVRDVDWDRAVRSDARDFARWMLLADKPVRPHWRRRDGDMPDTPATERKSAGSPNPVTGKPAPGTKYAPSTRAHCETVLRSFYDFHLDMGTGPVVNPFPLDRARRVGRAHARLQSDGAVSGREARAVPACGAAEDPAADPGREVR